MNSTNAKKKKCLFLHTVRAKLIPIKNIEFVGISSKFDSFCHIITNSRFPGFL